MSINARINSNTAFVREYGSSYAQTEAKRPRSLASTGTNIARIGDNSAKASPALPTSTSKTLQHPTSGGNRISLRGVTQSIINRTFARKPIHPQDALAVLSSDPNRVGTAQWSQQFAQLCEDLLENPHDKGAEQKLASLKTGVNSLLLRGFYAPLLPINVQGKQLQLGAFDFVRLFNKVQATHKKLVRHDIQQASNIQFFPSLHGSSFADLWKSFKADPQFYKLGSEDIRHFCGQLSHAEISANPHYNDALVQESKPFSEQDKVKAYAVLRALPKKYHRDLDFVSLSNLDRRTYTQRLQKALNQTEGSKKLQAFKNSVLSRLPTTLQTKFFEDPAYAFQLLDKRAQAKAAYGLENYSGYERARIADNVSELMQEIGKDLYRPETSRQLKSKTVLASYAATKQLWQAMRAVTAKRSDNQSLFCPSSELPGQMYKSVQCVRKNQVSISLPNNQGTGRLHANYLNSSLFSGKNQSLIAAQQPNGSAEENEKFVAMLQQNADLVIDLRNTEDLWKEASSDYTKISSTSKFENLDVSRQNLGKHNGLDHKRLQIKDGDQSKSVDVVEYRDWKDASTISTNRLRSLRDLLLQRADAGQSVAVHCRAGIGRTGTLIAYTEIYNQLIRQRNDIITPEALLTQVFNTILAFREQRGPAFVQTNNQLNLILQALTEDLEAAGRLDKNTNKGSNWFFATPAKRPRAEDFSDNDLRRKRARIEPAHLNPASSALLNRQSDQILLNPSSVWAHLNSNQPTSIAANNIATEVAALYPQSDCLKQGIIKIPSCSNGHFHYDSAPTAIHANNLKFKEADTHFKIAQAPHTEDDVWRHWFAIFESGSQVTEMVSDAKEKTSNNALANLFGLNFIHPALLDKPLDINIGPYQVTHVKETTSSNLDRPAGYDERQFEITVIDQRTKQVQKVPYRLIETSYESQLLSSDELLQIATDQSEETKAAPHWITSQCGAGRPSAIAIAQALMTGIKNGTIRRDNCDKSMLSMIQQGRETRGTQFVHSEAQLKQLYKLADRLFREKARGDRPCMRQAPAAETSSNEKKQPSGLGARLFRWSKALVNNLREAVVPRIESFQSLLSWLQGYSHRA